MASHIPVNHRLQPFYRFLAALAGVYVLVFGIIGVMRTGSHPLFDQNVDASVFGLRTNLAFAIISIIVGVIVLGGAIVGGNFDHFINLFGGMVFLVAGILMMALLETDANFLNFQMATCIVSFVIGIVLFTAGLYGRTGSLTQMLHEEQFRTHHVRDPEHHNWAIPPSVPRPVEDDPDVHRFA
jgi:Domain of unknown function (DUF4383)